MIYHFNWWIFLRAQCMEYVVSTTFLYLWPVMTSFWCKHHASKEWKWETEHYLFWILLHINFFFSFSWWQETFPEHFKSHFQYLFYDPGKTANIFQIAYIYSAITLTFFNQNLSLDWKKNDFCKTLTTFAKVKIPFIKPSNAFFTSFDSTEVLTNTTWDTKFFLSA